MKKMGIYVIVNTKNGKVYIGSTVNLGKRRCNHWDKLRREDHHNPHLQASWRKYGERFFEFGVLEYLDDPEELHLAEQFWMDVYREEGKELYNFGLAARHPMLGRKHTEEARQKMSAACRGLSRGTRRRTSGPRAPRGPHSEEHKRKISEALKGRPLSPERRRKLREANDKYWESKAVALPWR